MRKGKKKKDVHERLVSQINKIRWRWHIVLGNGTNLLEFVLFVNKPMVAGYGILVLPVQCTLGHIKFWYFGHFFARSTSVNAIFI